MAELFTIGELATAFSLSPRAIRFYEDQGLLAPERVGTQRVYTKRDRARLQLILRGKRLGFSLADIREFLDLYDADRSKHLQMEMTLGRTRARIRDLEQQLEDITITLAELRDMEAEVAAYTGTATPPPGPAKGSPAQSGHSQSSHAQSSHAQSGAKTPRSDSPAPRGAKPHVTRTDA